MSVVTDTEMRLRDIQRSRGPIVAGPWLSEIGFEVLYWIPFLRWCVRKGYVDRSRLVILSRGGCRSWYDFAAEYRDLLDVYTVDELRNLNDRRITEQGCLGRSLGLRIRPMQRTSKHLMIGTVDREILERFGYGGATVLHPSLMYRLFQEYWRKFIPDLYDQRTRIERLTATPKPDGLPNRYVAVKFYASNACMASWSSRTLVNQIIRVITRDIDVVLLHTGTAYDDHGEFPIDHMPRVHRLIFTPQANLEEQSAIIAGAQAFVGTYGGFAYVAPFLGVPTIALYASHTFRRDHLNVMTTVAALRLKVPFQVKPLSAGLSAIRPLIEKARHAA